MHKSKKLEGLSGTSQVMDHLGVTQKQLRDWIKAGLIEPKLYGEGETNKYKYYDEAAIRRINIIKIYRELDFPIDQIKSILSNPVKSEFEILSEQIGLLEEKRNSYDRMISVCSYISAYGMGSLDGMQNPAKNVDEYYQKLKNAMQARVAKMSSKDYSALSDEVESILIRFEINLRLNKSVQSEPLQDCVASLLHIFKRLYSFEPNAILALELYKQLRENPILHNMLLEITTEKTLSYVHDAILAYYLTRFEVEVTNPLAEKVYSVYETDTQEEFDAYKLYEKVSDYFFPFCISAYDIMGVNCPEGLKSYTWPIFFTSMPDDSICNVKDFNINEVYENFYQLLFFFGCKYLDENRAMLEPEYLKHDKNLYKELIDV